MKNKEKKRNFLNKMDDIYNDKNIHLSEKTKKEILKQTKDLVNNKTNINYASYHLYPLIKNEYYDNESENLDEFLKLILKYRWKSYFGMILGSAFSGFR